jgi:hypothetical protein
VKEQFAMRKPTVALAALSAVALLIPASSATAAAGDAAAGDAAAVEAGAVLTYGSAAGTDVPVGDTLTASLAEGTAVTFTSAPDSTSGVTCTTSSFTATVTANPAAPGVAGESLDAQSFSDCTANVFGILSVDGVTVDNLPYTVALDDTAGTAVVSGTPIQTTVVLSTLLGQITCQYQADSITATVAAGNESGTSGIGFANQAFAKTSGPGLCFATGYFSAQYAPVVDSSQPDSPAVFVN